MFKGGFPPGGRAGRQVSGVPDLSAYQAPRPGGRPSFSFPQSNPLGRSKSDKNPLGRGGDLNGSSYKESHAKSHNKFSVPCGSQYCNWALCDKPKAKTCERYLKAKEGLKECKGRGLSKRTVKSAKEDYQEFISDLRGCRGTYLGLGDEAVNCGRWGLLKECGECGLQIAKRLVDGREWCPICGQDSSEHHKRRISRLIDRIYCMLDTAGAVGYFVFEYPLVLREESKDINELREAGNYISRMLRREGFKRGLRRWHFYGDVRGIRELKAGDDRRVRKLVKRGQWHPHLNVMTESGYIELSKMKQIRKLWTRWLKVRYKKQFAGVAPVHYEYKTRPNKVWYLLKYVTRPTFKVLTNENRRVASELFGFKNTSWFGKFTGEDKARGRGLFEEWVNGLPERERDGLFDIEAVGCCEAGICPRCGGNLEVLGVVEVEDYVKETDYGAGYYAVRSPP